MTSLVLVMLVGGLVGAGLLLLVTVFDRAPVSGAAGLAQIDALRQRGARTASLTADRRHQDESVRKCRNRSGVSKRESRRSHRMPRPKTPITTSSTTWPTGVP